MDEIHSVQNSNLAYAAEVTIGMGAEATVAYVLLSSGSLKDLQTASIATSLPFLFIMIAMVPALMKELKREKIIE